MAKAAGGSERIRIAKGIHLYRRQGSDAWQADIVFRGRRARRSLGTTDYHEAETIALQQAGQYRTEAREGGDYSFVRALIDWTNYAPRSTKEASMVARLRELYSNRPAAEVTSGSLLSALAELSPGYANRILNIARAALNLAAELERIPVAPRIGRRETGPGRERFLSAEEWARLQKELPEHLEPIVRFSIETGLRKENALRLQWKNVDLRRGTAFVEAMRAKGRVSIPVPLSPAALAILKAQRGRHDVFVWTWRPSPVKKPDHYVPIGDPKKAWNAALQRAGIEDFRWHDQRHTWASWQTMSGTRPQALKELGGWASMDMVERYAHLDPEHLRQFAGAAGAALTAAVKRVQKKRKKAA